MSENDRMTAAAGVVGAATLGSRILGYLRDMVFAWFFGAGPVSDAFIAAFRIPNLFRRLFGEGSLTGAFVPVLTETLVTGGKKEAFRLAGSVLRVLSALLVGVTVAGALFSPVIIKGIAYGFAEYPATYTLAVDLSRIMFPYVLMICLVAFCMGVLNVLGHFAAPALAPVLLNVAMIGSMAAGSRLFSDATHRAYALAWGVLIGGVLQLLLQLPFLLRAGFTFWQKAPLYHSGLKRIGRLMLPATYGAAVFQINTLVQTLLASLLATGSISYLYYADRLVQFPLAIFGLAVATAALPSLSRQAAARDLDAFRATFLYSLNLTLFISVPAMVGLMVLREPVIDLLFQRGAFDEKAARLTASALLHYSWGLWAFAAVRVVISAFYALQDTQTPVKIATISIAANFVFGWALMGDMEHAGLALALSLASTLNFVLLLGALKRRVKGLDWSLAVRSTAKTLTAAAVMGMGVWGTGKWAIPSVHTDGLTLGLGLFGCIVVGLILYGVCAHWFRSPELQTILTLLRKGVFRRWT